jgi:hypothetical protein
MDTNYSEICIKVSIKAIHDGTNGISLSAPDKLLGEWTDSGAYSLIVTPESRISICGENGTQRYLLTLPGIPMRGEQLSGTEAAIVVRM